LRSLFATATIACSTERCALVERVTEKTPQASEEREMVMMTLVTGCPGKKTDSQPAPSQATTLPGFVDEVAIVKADATPPDVQAALQALALDTRGTATNSY